MKYWDKACSGARRYRTGDVVEERHPEPCWNCNSGKCVCWNESEDRGPAVIVIELKERGYSKECAEVETEGLSS